MDNPSYEADEKGSVHLQSIKRIKEPDNLKVRQSNDTYTNRSFCKNKYFHQMCHCEQITFTWENITVVKENGGGSCFRKKIESSKTILNNGEYVEKYMTPYSQI